MIDQEGGLVARLPGAPVGLARADGPPRRGATCAARAADGGEPARGRHQRRPRAGRRSRPARELPGADRQGVRAQPRGGRGARQRFARGLQEGGVAATLKHFPGLGGGQPRRGRADPDGPALGARRCGAPTRRRSRPAIRAGARLVMTSTARYPALDGRRVALLSRRITTTELRGRLGFRGVAITDDLDVTAMRRLAGPGTLAVRATAAGNDVLLFAQDPDRRAARAERGRRRGARRAPRRAPALRRPWRGWWRCAARWRGERRFARARAGRRSRAVRRDRRPTGRRVPLLASATEYGVDGLAGAVRRRRSADADRERRARSASGPDRHGRLARRPSRGLRRRPERCGRARRARDGVRGPRRVIRAARHYTAPLPSWNGPLSAMTAADFCAVAPRRAHRDAGRRGLDRRLGPARRLQPSERRGVPSGEGSSLRRRLSAQAQRTTRAGGTRPVDRTPL